MQIHRMKVGKWLPCWSSIFLPTTSFQHSDSVSFLPLQAIEHIHCMKMDSSGKVVTRRPFVLSYLLPDLSTPIRHISPSTTGKTAKLSHEDETQRKSGYPMSPPSLLHSLLPCATFPLATVSTFLQLVHTQSSPQPT